MTRPALLQAVSGLVTALAATFLAAAPADAGQLVPPLTTNHAEYQLTHAETVQLFNDPGAAAGMCSLLLQDLNANGILAPNITWFSCLVHLPACADAAVAEGAQEVAAIGTWVPFAYTCDPD